MEFTYKEMRAFAVDFAYYIYGNDLGTLSHERYKEHFDEWIKAKLPQADVIKSVCDHRNYRAGHSPFVPCICNDCGEEL